jgi:hypothetical protein
LSAASPERDRDLVRIEKQIRQAIRDAVNRNSRKPFYWGGLAGYHQLKAIAQALDQIIPSGEGSAYLRRLTQPVERVLEKNRTLAAELQQAHQWLERIARCLRYPSSSCTKGKSEHISQAAGVVKVSSFQVAENMEALLQEFHPNAWRQPVQARLLDALQKRWRSYGQELLYCYDIPGLSPDNLQMESLFGRLRRNQRRISGRKSTRELRDFGQVQVLFDVESEALLLQQIQGVPLGDYQAERVRLAEAEEPRQFFHRLHHDPQKTIQTLIEQHSTRCNELRLDQSLPVQEEPRINTS